MTNDLTPHIELDVMKIFHIIYQCGEILKKLQNTVG